MKILAHRGAHERFPENSIRAFEEALALGADGIELDVRLTKDQIAVVLHPAELREALSMPGFVFDSTFEELRSRPLVGPIADGAASFVPSLAEVLDRFAGRALLDIEIKAPEPEAAMILVSELRGFRAAWDSIEVTSFEPAMLRETKRLCPALATNLLMPPSEPWMSSEHLGHLALNRARLAQASGVHLFPDQFSLECVELIRAWGLEVHSGRVNDETGFKRLQEFGIYKFDTDRVPLMLEMMRANR